LICSGWVWARWLGGTAGLAAGSLRCTREKRGSCSGTWGEEQFARNCSGHSLSSWNAIAVFVGAGGKKDPFWAVGKTLERMARGIPPFPGIFPGFLGFLRSGRCRGWSSLFAWFFGRLLRVLMKGRYFLTDLNRTLSGPCSGGVSGCCLDAFWGSRKLKCNQ
jgi:hypothetical protein